MNIHLLDPLSDHRWDELVARHPRGSAFHQRGWLESLSRTYGYKPLVVTSTSAEEPLNDGIVLCCVSSWITGTRLVSLPFADHCDPLLNDAGESLGFVDWLKSECDCRGWKYVELRPRLGTEDLQHQMPGNAPELFVNARSQLLQRVLVTLGPGAEKVRSFRTLGICHRAGLGGL